MAIVKMKHLRLVAMQVDREKILHTLQRMGCVEIDEPRVDWSDSVWAELGRPSGENLSAARERKSAGEQALSVLKRYAPEKGGLFRERPVLTEEQLFEPQVCQQAAQAVQSINNTQQRIAALQAQKTKLEGQKAVLAPWLSLDVPLNTESTREVFIEFGTVPVGMDLTALKGTLWNENELVEVTAAGTDREYRYLMLVYHASAAEAVSEVMREHGWSKSNLRDWTGTAAENDRRIDRELEETVCQLQQAEQELAVQGGHRESIYQQVDRSTVEIDRESARSRLVDTQHTFFLDGWLPAEQWANVRKSLSEFDCAFQAEDPAPEEYPNVPVKLKNNWFTQPLNMVTNMYVMPAYDGLDPNPLMAPFFIIFYGLMMADMGYGILMLLGAWVMLKKMHAKGGMKDFGGLLLLCGISTLIWGALTGGFFGDFLTQLTKLIDPESNFALPYLFTPLTDTLMILVGSLVLGVIQIFTGMTISVVKKCKDGNWQDALWEEGSWWMILIGGALAVLGIGTVGGYPVVLLAGILMLVYGATRNAKGFGKLTSLIGAVYNGVTGYFSDTLSYARLMALMLAGSVIAQVFNTLGSVTGNVAAFVLVSFVGNMLNFALNLLGCYVHDLRLQCLEFFNRFYKEGGKPFKPMGFETKYVDIMEQK